MWTRAQLKDKAKFALKHNYWKAVLVSLIITAILGGTSYTFSYDLGEEMAGDVFGVMDQSDPSDMEYSDQYYLDDNSEEYWEGYYDGYFGDVDERSSKDYVNGYNDGLLDKAAESRSDFENLFDFEGESAAYVVGVLAVFFVIFIVVFVIVLAISLVWSAFITNPVQMGCDRFFFKTLNQKAEVKEVAFAFDNNYKNVIKILFFRNLYTALWSLLFCIPGIVKSYEYRMIPYLLAENPNLTKEQAFEISKQMMTGNKWKTFVLDLSFLGWDFLSIFTAGILETFYVGPYRNLTNAALYEQLSLIHGRPAFSVHQPNMGAPMQQGQPMPQVQPMQMNPFAQPMEAEQPMAPAQPAAPIQSASQAQSEMPAETQVEDQE